MFRANKSIGGEQPSAQKGLYGGDVPASVRRLSADGGVCLSCILSWSELRCASNLLMEALTKGDAHP